MGIFITIYITRLNQAYLYFLYVLYRAQQSARLIKVYSLLFSFNINQDLDRRHQKDLQRLFRNFNPNTQIVFVRMFSKNILHLV